jgi:hypothetical protein
MLLGLGVIGAVACSTTDTTAVPLDGETGYWRLRMNYQAVTLSTIAPYDTIQLIATPCNAYDVPLPQSALDSAVTTYQLQDPNDTSLTITADGFVHALHPHDGVLVNITTTVRGMTRVDTISFNVTNVSPPPHLTTFTLTVTPDSLTDTFLLGAGQGTLKVQALDSLDKKIPHVVVHFSTADQRMVQLSSGGGVSGTVQRQRDGIFVHPGRAMLFAEATVYGITMRDSTFVTITPPGFGLLTAVFGTPKAVGRVVGQFEPAVDTVHIVPDPYAGTGATVAFLNATTTPIDVVFDDPTAFKANGIETLFCGTSSQGNVPAFVHEPTTSCFLGQSGFRLRLITSPGTYHYHSAMYGTSGAIVVLP